MPTNKEIIAWMKKNYRNAIDKDGINCIALQEDACFHFDLYENDEAPDWIYDLAIDASSDIEASLAANEDIKKEEARMCKCASFW